MKRDTVNATTKFRIIPSVPIPSGDTPSHQCSAVLSSAAGPIENILIARYTPSRYHGLGFGAGALHMETERKRPDGESNQRDDGGGEEGGEGEQEAFHGQSLSGQS